MPCTPFTLPDGSRGLACSSSRRPRCACGQRSTRLCDWKVEGGTCDRPLCSRCTLAPAPDKDLCPQHAAEWKTLVAHQAEQRRAAP